MRPPRALSVTFDFGRPLGRPGDPATQLQVMRAALRLLDRTDVPVLVDFVDEQGPDVPQSEDALDGMACMLPPRTEIRDLKEAVRREMAGLRPLYETVAARPQGAPIDLLGLPIEVVAEFVLSFLDPVPADNPRPDLPLQHVLKLAVDDLVAFYNVAALARAGATSSPQQISRWFWHKAALGTAIRSLRNRLLVSEDPVLKAVAFLTVAWIQLDQPIEFPVFAESYEILKREAIMETPSAADGRTG